MSDDRKFVTIIRMYSLLIEKEDRIYHCDVFAFFNSWENIALYRYEIGIRLNEMIQSSYIHDSAIFTIFISMAVGLGQPNETLPNPTDCSGLGHSPDPMVGSKIFDPIPIPIDSLSRSQVGSSLVWLDQLFDEYSQ